MIFKSEKGMYLLKNNFRDAFKLQEFCDKYIEEVFDDDLYIVGDISSGILRLKGFSTKEGSINHVSLMDKYFEESCVIGSPFFVLKRIKSEEEYERLSKNPNLSKTDTDGFTINTIEKISFDKDSLVLNSNPKGKSNIVIDSEKMNSIPRGELPPDLKDTKETKSDFIIKPQVEENTQTYVSSSPDFDPSKKEKKNFNQNRNRNQNNNNNNNQNGNNNKNRHFKKNKNKNRE
ncbi:MAG: DUF1027 domain-containing protein [Acholeplasmatales bacterium]|nr:DUF1027 domain-containing protein [Acholeplasmatales bacterium]